jgi:nucleoside-diphosphate-sugar epimerase
VSVSLQGAEVPAQIGFAVGQEFPLWRLTVVCEDGAITADMISNRTSVAGRTRWLEAIDLPVSALRGSVSEIRQAGGNFLATALGMAGIGQRADPFQRSMSASIAAFHRALDADTRPASDLAFGAVLVQACERIAAGAFRSPGPALPTVAEPDAWDVAVLGGTGFIGAHVVRALLDAGKRVSVLARSTAGLPDLYRDTRVKLVAGDIRDPVALGAAIGTAPVAINLAHGGGGESYAAILAAMQGGVEAVVGVCRERNVRRLVHIGSIASLYLGTATALVTGATPPDPQADRRADYARAKAACDQLLMRLHRDENLPVTILRPGLVVGQGASPFHSGLGFYNNTQHCLGWNAGRNPLPFVLAEDVAAAILLACDVPAIDGHCYNLVGDVRWNARRYIAELAATLGRPLHFHPQSPLKLWLAEWGKWAIKRAAGRTVALPSWRDLLSRGMRAAFDCTDVKRDLGWVPVADETAFRTRAILVHASMP